MMLRVLVAILLILAGHYVQGKDFTPAPQRFRQEIATRWGEREGLPTQPVQLLDIAPGGEVRAFSAGRWYELHETRWTTNTQLTASSESTFVFADAAGQRLEVAVPWHQVRQFV